MVSLAQQDLAQVQQSAWHHSLGQGLIFSPSYCLVHPPQKLLTPSAEPFSYNLKYKFTNIILSQIIQGQSLFLVKQLLFFRQNKHCDKWGVTAVPCPLIVCHKNQELSNNLDRHNLLLQSQIYKSAHIALLQALAQLNSLRQHQDLYLQGMHALV